jgi:hypothetical protein
MYVCMYVCMYVIYVCMSLTFTTINDSCAFKTFTAGEKYWGRTTKNERKKIK